MLRDGMGRQIAVGVAYYYRVGSDLEPGGVEFLMGCGGGWGIVPHATKSPNKKETRFTDRDGAIFSRQSRTKCFIPAKPRTRSECNAKTFLCAASCNVYN